MRLEFNKDWLIKSKDSGWRKIEIPHDAMLENGRDAEAKGGSASGFFKGGKYLYKKQLHVTEEEAEQCYTLEFGGVYKNAKVFVNGKYAGGCAYGYCPFRVYMNEFLKTGENEILVEVDNSSQPDSRWYTGAGIYRSVYLNVQNTTVRLLPEKIRITTLDINPVRLQIETGHIGGRVYVQIRDLKTEEKIIGKEGDKIEIQMENAVLWNSENPYLYEICIQLIDKNEIIEETKLHYGIRKVDKRKDGIYINGKKTLLKGGCIHHDNGILGAKEYQESADRKIQILKSNGFNAIRSAHNPCSEEILKACDKYGMYVMDETWDMWYRKKNPYDYAMEFQDNYKKDIQGIVEKDYNHPSVILYSIGNEVSEPMEKKGLQLAKELVELFHKEDPTRLVTGGFNLMIMVNAAKGKQMYKDDGGLNKNQDVSGMNSTMFNMIASATGSGMNKAANGKKADIIVSQVLDFLDVAGYNYASGRYKEDQKRHPDRLIIGSETFPQDLAKNWKIVQRMQNVVGDFMWTAWDYLGEAGLGAWSYEVDAKGFSKPYPWLLADTGVFDILGNPTGEALWCKVLWKNESNLEIAVRPCNHPREQLIKAVWRGTNAIPSWSWKGCDGNKTIVEVYAKAFSAELYINDKRVGKKRIKGGKAEFPVKYMPGELKAIIYDRQGNEIGEKELVSGTGEVSPEIVNSKENIKSGDICYLDISMMYENGVTESNSDERLSIQIENGELLGFGSANPKTIDDFLSGNYTTWYGKAQAVVKAGQEGKMKIILRSKECEKKREWIIHKR